MTKPSKPSKRNSLKPNTSRPMRRAESSSGSGTLAQCPSRPPFQPAPKTEHPYEGTVNQVLGDGIMALFGAPLAHEDHAVRACYAALAMQAAVQQYAEGVRRQQGLDVQIRIGLNAGEVVVRTISNDLHMDYSAIRQTTHLAARME